MRPPATVTNATKAYRADMDLVAQFIGDCCIEAPGAEETVKALYSDFTQWCHDNGEMIMTQRSFGQRLAERGYKDTRTGKARKRRGIKLKTDLELAALALALRDDASDARSASE